MAMGIQSIRYLSNCIPIKARIQLLHALVISHLNYSSLIFNGISQHNKNKLEKQLNWGLRVCFNAPQTMSVHKLKQRARLLNTDFSRKYFTLNKFASIYANTSKPFETIDFPNLQIRENKRGNRQLQPLKCRRKILQDSFLSNAIKFWNAIPKHIKDVASNQKKFKRWIFNHLMHEQSTALPWRLNNVWGQYKISY